jgi:KDO2-lipid IV(A) lauroyltransferase
VANEDPAGEDEEGGAPSTTIRHRLEYLLVRATQFAILCTDVRGAMRIGRVLGRLLGAVDRRHRVVAVENLRGAYGPTLGEEEADRMALRVYERLGGTAAEMIHGPRLLRGRAARRRLPSSGAEGLLRAAQGRPVVLLSGHLGNWEFLVPAARIAGFDLVPVARPLDNPLLDRWLEGLRAAMGNRPLPKRGALRSLVRAVRAGRSIGLLVDQNAGRRGKLSTFFGRPCSTQVAGIALARRMKIPFAVVSLERSAPGIHRFVLGPPMYVRDDDEAEARAVDEMNRQLEERVRRRPEDWMWLHRRWRIKAAWGFPVEATESAWKGEGTKPRRQAALPPR